jgi:hypothetical protein
MTADEEFDDLAQELRAMRAEPRPEYARELDRRAASWLRERPRRRLPSLRIAIPAAAAAATAAAVVALAISGGGDADPEQLEVAVVAEGAPGGGAAAPEALGAPQDRGSADATGGAFLLPRVEDETVTVRYLFARQSEARVELAGSEAEVEVGPGPGSLEISTEGLPAGTHELTISTASAPTFRTPVEIGD